MPDVIQRHAGSGAVLDRLKDHAIAIGEFYQLIELFPGCFGVDVEQEADLLEANRHALGYAKRAAQVNIAFGRYYSRVDRNFEHRRRRSHRNTSAGDQCFEEHVARTELLTCSASFRMNTGERQSATRLDFAGYGGLAG